MASAGVCSVFVISIDLFSSSYGSGKVIIQVSFACFRSIIEACAFGSILVLVLDGSLKEGMAGL